MRSSIVIIFRRVLVLVLVLVVGMTNFVAPASASEEFIEKEPYAVELAKKVADTGIFFLTPPVICLTADAIASGFFPPAAALAPYCAAFAAPSGAIAAGGNVIRKVMAH